MDSRDLPRESAQDGPWKGKTDELPSLTGAAAGAESQDALEGGRVAEAGWLSSVGSDLRSFLGIAALVVFVLPAIILVLTLLGNDLKPVPIEKATARGGRNALVHHDRPQGGGRNDHPPDRNGGPPGTDSEANGVGPTRQTASGQREAPQAQGATVTTAPATSSATASASAAASPEPASSSSAPATGSVAAGSAPATSSATASPAASTAPATATQPTSAPAGSAPPASQQPSSPNASAPPLAGAMPTPGDVPVGGVQGGVPADAGTYDPSK